ncbi:hypothetical protein [Bradyrhizobium sp. 192]|uniref:hypothetical protein n=1 Tax=Bradyrhizobium sp. 192 TaxID=2782660 RepID=UPI0020000380|nr:hypothetical protein [Bradyrhizobium sp. 192]UPJ61952.1 hypothetical protein IVB24_12015 [Bradyrhizobium sp. 192]
MRIIASIWKLMRGAQGSRFITHVLRGSTIWPVSAVSRMRGAMLTPPPCGYVRLLETTLTEVERQYIERRLAEERSATELLSTSSVELAVDAKDADPAGIRPPNSNDQPCPSGIPCVMAPPWRMHGDLLR